MVWDEMHACVQLWLSSGAGGDGDGVLLYGPMGSPQFGNDAPFGSLPLPLPDMPLSPGSYPPGLPTAVMVSF
jgi:hypothetical protein